MMEADSFPKFEFTAISGQRGIFHHRHVRGQGSSALDRAELIGTRHDCPICLSLDFGRICALGLLCPPRRYRRLRF